jgi:acyl-CoA thioesterase I
MMRRPSAAAAVALALIASAARPAVDDGNTTIGAAACLAPPGLIALGASLPHVGARIKLGEPLTIVALGSSSTRGVGASAPQLSYPSRLETELKKRLPGIDVRVLNRGRSGEEVPQMVARLDRDVLAVHPDLVIWQFGTNAVLHHDAVGGEREPVARGIARLRESGTDVVLMDLQYAPRVLARPDYATMEQLIADAAQTGHVGLFRRFAIMQAWRVASPQDNLGAISGDGLHMNDFGYRCLAADLAEALADSWRSGTHGRNAPSAGIVAHLRRPSVLSAARAVSIP